MMERQACGHLRQSPLHEAALTTREHFLQRLALLPSPMSEIAAGAFRRRVSRAGSEPMLGEFVPWLFADILAVNDVVAVRKVAVGWLNVYLFTLMLDDVLDGHSPGAQAAELVTSALLLQQGITALVADSADPESMRQVIDQSFGTTAHAAMMELIHHRNRVRAFTGSEIMEVGHKVALLHICGRALEQCLPNKRQAWLPYVIDRLGTGLQLLDDLTDWAEDYRTGNFTLPLTIMLERSRDSTPGTDRADRSEIRLIHDLVVSGAIQDTLLAATAALTDVLENVPPTHAPTEAIIYLTNIESVCRSVCSQITTIRRLIADATPWPDAKSTPPDDLRIILHDAREQLDLVAQSS